MPHQQFTNISTFFIAGINYKKTDATIRGDYAINTDQYATLLALAPQLGVKELFILSTCNRTEIYGFAESAQQLCQLLCAQTQGSLTDFMERAYVKKGKKAIEHLFEVAAGLDSQILGDYEIVGQIKQAVKFSKQHHCVGAYLERMVNGVLQASKMIKNSTELSGGTVSVSFAAIQYIKENVAQLSSKKILVIGTGKMGSNTVKNLVDYLDTTNITLINRTAHKAEELAAALGVSFAPIDQIAQHIDQGDIIIVATNAAEPIILAAHLRNSTTKLIIDLSIPYNVEMAAQQLPQITLINVDELSKIKDSTLQKREAEVPKAMGIIEAHINEFMGWHEMRKNVPVLKAVKNKLEQMNQTYFTIASASSEINVAMDHSNEDKIQKVINGMAVKMRSDNQKGCYYIEAINEYIAIGTN